MAEEIKKEEQLGNCNFIHDFIDEDIAEGGQFEGKTVHTRFPPEPNGYLHIGHAKAICIDFGTAEKYNGMCNLRMDDTNPTKEDVEYVDAIKEDIQWLGADWKDNLFFASDYFEVMYECAIKLIKKGKAYFYTVLEGNKIEKCEIIITKVKKQTKSDIKGITFTVTDEKVLNSANGIVQGMSGSPIVQDGKLIGCVTHVDLSNSQIGYGLFIQWMLENDK